mgnify:FL=1
MDVFIKSLRAQAKQSRNMVQKRLLRHCVPRNDNEGTSLQAQASTISLFTPAYNEIYFLS